MKLLLLGVAPRAVDAALEPLWPKFELPPLKERPGDIE
jgi:hypothetical protein